MKKLGRYAFHAPAVSPKADDAFVESVAAHTRWRMHGRKKMVGYCPQLDMDVQIERIKQNDAPTYSIGVRIAGQDVNLMEKFPTFANQLRGPHANVSSAWVFFMHAFDQFAKKLAVAILKAEQQDAQPTQEEAVQS